MERKRHEPGLIDGLVADLGGPRTAAFFDRAQRLIDWDRLVEPLAGLVGEQPRGGRPFLPLLLMVKCLLIQKWFGLSDPQLEEQLRDRLSFRRFAGLSLDEEAPDETSFVTFRKRLREAGLSSAIFDAALASLADKGLVLREGTLIDATIVEAPPGSKRPDGTHSKDRCATYTRNHGTLRHGYKAHLATDTRGIVTGYVFDTAKVHDSNHADALLAGETRAAYADSAYRSKDRVSRLKRRGVFPWLVQKRVRGQKELTRGQRLFNRACARVRSIVEHPRAWMVKMGYTAARYRGLVRNAMDLAHTAAAYNLKRSFSLLGEPLTKPRPHRHNGVAVAVPGAVAGRA